MADQIKDTEKLARFIKQSGHFTESTKRVKHSAFYPPKNKSTTSVFRHDNNSKKELIKISKCQNIIFKKIASITKKNVILSGKNSKVDLQVVSDTTNNQHPSHAHIQFPFQYPDTIKKRFKPVCMEMAKHATLIED